VSIRDPEMRIEKPISSSSPASAGSPFHNEQGPRGQTPDRASGSPASTALRGRVCYFRPRDVKCGFRCSRRVTEAEFAELRASIEAHGPRQCFMVRPSANPWSGEVSSQPDPRRLHARAMPPHAVRSERRRSQAPALSQQVLRCCHGHESRITPGGR
jgi:hypothetical protein